MQNEISLIVRRSMLSLRWLTMEQVRQAALPKNGSNLTKRTRMAVVT